MIEPTLYLYIKQDGMYNTLDLLITDEFKSKEDLPRDWYRHETALTFNKLVWYAYSVYFDHYCSKIRYNVEDEYIIDLDNIKMLFPEEMI